MKKAVLLLTSVFMMHSSANTAATLAGEVSEGRSATLLLESTEQSNPLVHATYLKPAGLEMIKPGGAYSPDNGRTWTARPVSPDFDSTLPYGYRRDSFPLFVDPVNEKVLQLVPSMDTPGLDPKMIEPPVALETYYLRYRVSIDGGKTFLFDEPIVEKGRTPENPFEDIYRGKNGIFMGDVGSRIIRTRSGRIIIPAQACKLGPDGKLFNPGGGFTWTDAIMILGSWQDDHRIQWQASQPIQGDPARSTRGMIEPTLAEMPDGRLLCVMRGSNGGSKDPEFKLPAHKWYAISSDDGQHWTSPEPWTYDDGSAFFSPSAMSQLLPHSSGRYFWIGNLSPSNCQANNPRYPLVIGEVDAKTLKLLKSTVLVVDTKRAGEPGLNLSHFWGFEDRATHDILIVGARHSQGYESATPVTYRIRIH